MSRFVIRLLVALVVAADIATAVWLAGHLESAVKRKGWGATSSVFLIIAIAGCIGSVAWIVHVLRGDDGLIEWLQIVRAGGLG